MGFFKLSGSLLKTAGHPLAKCQAGTSFVTIAPPAMKAPSPIVIPGIIVAFDPTVTSSSTVIGSGLYSVLSGFLSFVSEALGPKKTRFPILVPVGM